MALRPWCGIGAQADPNKWNLPGWKIEQKYKNQTLIGNWSEERQLFERKNFNHISTHQADYVPYPGHKPNSIARRYNSIQREGLNEKFFTRHNDDRWDHMKITWYDENFNKRPRTGKNKLPELRRYNFTHCEWRPEKSDHPIEGEPTNFGLLEEHNAAREFERECWKRHVKQPHSHCAYKAPKQDAFPARYGIAPKALSSKFVPNTQVNRNLNLRGSPYFTAPERPPRIVKPTKQYPIIAPLPVAHFDRPEG